MTCRELTGVIIACVTLSIGTMSAQSSLPASTDSTMYTVTTREGMLVEGNLQGWISDTLVLKTRDGVTARIPASSIMNLSHGRTPVPPRATEAGPSASHSESVSADLPSMHRSRNGSPNLFMIPTAYPEAAGDVRLGVQEVFFPTIAYGIAGYLTVQGGTSILPEAEGFLLHGTLKATPISGQLGAIAAGVTVVSIEDMFSTVPFLIGTVNLGGYRSSHLTCGIGYQSDENDMFMVAGIDLPVSDHVRIVSELFLMREGRKISYLTPGVKFQTGRFDIDLGVILPFSMKNLGYLPWIGASVVL